MIEELLGLEECAGDVQAAVSRGDYFAAVKRIAPLARALEVDEDSEAPHAAQPSTSESPGGGRRARHEGERAAEVVNSLRTKVAAELDKAALGSDVGVVCSFVRLMAELGREREGERAALRFFSAPARCKPLRSTSCSPGNCPRVVAQGTECC